MGVHCEINLSKPSDGVFTPGTTVSGMIRYAVDKPTVFNRITISLKGAGNLSMKHKHRNKRRMRHTCRNHEEYVNDKVVVHDDEKGLKEIPVGQYELQFNFKLPEKIPPTFKCLKNLPRYVVRCNIDYSVGIKFERPGLLNFNKKYHKELVVISGISARLPDVPTIHGEQKTLMSLFSSKKSIVNIKATIKNSVVRPGGKVEVSCEVVNDTNVDIKSVESKLVEVYNFTSSRGREVKASEDVKETDSKTGSIKSAETKTTEIEIVPPSDKISLDYSRMVVRDYVVRIEVALPLPHRNAILEIPVQIGEVDSQPKDGSGPPSYWEAMSEFVKDEEYTAGKDDDDDGDISEDD